MLIKTFNFNVKKRRCMMKTRSIVVRTCKDDIGIVTVITASDLFDGYCSFLLVRVRFDDTFTVIAVRVCDCTVTRTTPAMYRLDV